MVNDEKPASINNGRPTRSPPKERDRRRARGPSSRRHVAGGASFDEQSNDDDRRVDIFLFKPEVRRPGDASLRPSTMTATPPIDGPVHPFDDAHSSLSPQNEGPRDRRPRGPPFRHCAQPLRGFVAEWYGADRIGRSRQRGEPQRHCSPANTKHRCRLGHSCGRQRRRIVRPTARRRARDLSSTKKRSPRRPSSPTRWPFITVGPNRAPKFSKRRFVGYLSQTTRRDNDDKRGTEESRRDPKRRRTEVTRLTLEALCHGHGCTAR